MTDAAERARRLIHGNDVEGLKSLLAEHPALLAWRDDKDHDGLLGFATGAYGDAGTPERERWFTRAECAEVLLDAGAIVTTSVCEGVLQSRARGLLQLFHRKGRLPRTPRFFAALGDLDSVLSAIHNSSDLAALTAAFSVACAFANEGIAKVILERAMTLDPELGTRVDSGVGRQAFIKFFVEGRPADTKEFGLWTAFVMGQVAVAVQDDDVIAMVGALQRDPWLLGDDHVEFQNGLIANAALNGREMLLVALFQLDPAILRRQPAPPSQAVEFAVTYGHPHLIPLLTRIWPVPDDLPFAAGTGNLPRVKQWFDASGAPALGRLDQHYPHTDPRARGDLYWNPPSVQHVLDVALAYAVINRHFDVADFLLAHGANVSTNWNSHEPASILHHLVFLEDSYESMQYLIDRGIDLTMKDHRWDSTAQGWARYGKGDEKMAKWLEEAERRRDRRL